MVHSCLNLHMEGTAVACSCAGCMHMCCDGSINLARLTDKSAMQSRDQLALEGIEFQDTLDMYQTLDDYCDVWLPFAS